MDVILDKSDYNEILRYAGWHGTKMDELTAGQLDESIALANKIASVRFVWKMFNINETDEGIALEGTDTILTGNSIRKHLKGSSRAVLFCITLGPSIDREVERLMLTNKGLAVFLNAAAVQMVEKAGDELQRLIDAKLENGAKTGQRFSPGYGDLPLSEQNDFMKLLDMERSVGVRLTESLLMKPFKSITAVAGIIEG